MRLCKLVCVCVCVCVYVVSIFNVVPAMKSMSVLKCRKRWREI